MTMGGPMPVAVVARSARRTMAVALVVVPVLVVRCHAVELTRAGGGRRRGWAKIRP
jgi:hypothetical protein